MEQWRRRLSVNMDSTAAPEAGGGAAEDPDEDTAGGNYEFVAEGERKQAGTLLSVSVFGCDW